MAEQRLAMPDRADPSHTGDVFMVMRLSLPQDGEEIFLSSRLGRVNM